MEDDEYVDRDQDWEKFQACKDSFVRGEKLQESFCSLRETDDRADVNSDCGDESRGCEDTQPRAQGIS